MVSSIRFPLEVRQPDREGYEDTYEETRERTDMTTGAPRIRQMYRTSPRIFTCRWTLSQSAFQEFDRWFQDVLIGGGREFDLLLIDNTEALTWFTCKWYPTTYTSSQSQDNKWVVSATLWSNKPGFADRPSGTDELIGKFAPQLNAKGALQIGVNIIGRADMVFRLRGTLATGFAGSANMNARFVGRLVTGMYGSFKPIMKATGVLQVGDA